MKCLCFLFAFATLISRSGIAYRVIVDPGHGGVDGGTTRLGIREADIALSVAQILQEKLLSQDFEVVMTREKDQNLGLEKRVDIAEKYRGDIFVSLHVNSSPSRLAKGYEVYFLNQLPADEEMLYLAANEEKIGEKISTPNSSFNQNSDDGDGKGGLTKKSDVQSIVEDLKRQRRMQSSRELTLSLHNLLKFSDKKEAIVIKQAPFYVLSKVNIPSVLIELGFISNPKEMEKLSKSSYQAELAEKICRGIMQYHNDQLLSKAISLTRNEMR